MKKILIKIIKIIWVISFIIVNIELFMWLKTIYFIGLLLVILIFYFIKFKLWLNNRKTTSLYKSNSLITFGYKGTGKDLLTQLIIVIRFKKIFKKQIKKLEKKFYDKYITAKNLNTGFIEWCDSRNYYLTFENYLRYIEKYPVNYLSNMDYGYGCKITHMGELSLEPNTYKNLIENNIKIVEKNNSFEGLDYYGSDMGAYLASHEDSMLNKLYPSYPLKYAFSRQTYNMLIQLNTQALDRIWKKVREQQDGYMKLLKTIPKNKTFLQKIWFKLPYFKNYIFIKYRFYREYESAKAGKLPFNKVGMLTRNNALYNTTPDTLKEMYENEHGEIKERVCVISVKDIKYDTRYFHELFFGYKYKEEEPAEHKPKKTLPLFLRKKGNKKRRNKKDLSSAKA